MSTKTGTIKFTGRKAVFLNYAEDGLKIRSNKIESKKVYKRKPKNSRQQDW